MYKSEGGDEESVGGGESEVETCVEVVDAGFSHEVVDVFTEVMRVFTRVVAEL